MTEFEEIIDTLEDLVKDRESFISEDEENDNKCVFIHDKAMLLAAVDLLKKNQPRLLTLEEIPEYDGAFLIEYRHEVWPMQWALFRLNLTMSYRFIRGDSELGFSISKDLYGKTWRCWTARPSKIQRWEAKWG